MIKSRFEYNLDRISGRPRSNCISLACYSLFFSNCRLCLPQNSYLFTLAKLEALSSRKIYCISNLTVQIKYQIEKVNYLWEVKTMLFSFSFFFFLSFFFLVSIPMQATPTQTCKGTTTHLFFLFLNTHTRLSHSPPPPTHTRKEREIK